MSAKAIPNYRHAFDEWTRGGTRGEAGNALSASIRMYPELRGRGRLVDSWYLLSAWARYEIPCRAPPMPVEVLLALAWYFVRMNCLGGAVMLVIGFDCFLRTGEMLSLIHSDLTFAPAGTGVVRLTHTKTGQRHGAFEASTINDPLCGQLYRASASSCPATLTPGITSSCRSLTAFTSCSRRASGG